jgi:hypothetical protein
VVTREVGVPLVHPSSGQGDRNIADFSDRVEASPDVFGLDAFWYVEDLEFFDFLSIRRRKVKNILNLDASFVLGTKV